MQCTPFTSSQRAVLYSAAESQRPERQNLWTWMPRRPRPAAVAPATLASVPGKPRFVLVRSGAERGGEGNAMEGFLLA